ncbi:hypothetical protein L612_000100002780 [Rhodococcus rhodochrous J38]|nr:hypothetical protein L612_000100002780 [Rhodococcus rhodochrous J38]
MDTSSADRSAGARSRLTLDEAVATTRTGDLWIFRGAAPADRAIQTLTNAPVNHVGMTVALEDLPPLMWHAELGRSLPDMWTGRHQRGVQLHDLRSAVQVWAARYGQRGWLRQISVAVTPDQEDQLLRTIARLDGTPFPSTTKLTGRWFAGRLPRRRRAAVPSGGLESAYCAEVVGLTLEEMGLLRQRHRGSNWYPGPPPACQGSGAGSGAAPACRSLPGWSSVARSRSCSTRTTWLPEERRARRRRTWQSAQRAPRLVVDARPSDSCER